MYIYIYTHTYIWCICIDNQFISSNRWSQLPVTSGRCGTVFDAPPRSKAFSPWRPGACKGKRLVNRKHNSQTIRFTLKKTEESDTIWQLNHEPKPWYHRIFSCFVHPQRPLRSLRSILLVSKASHQLPLLPLLLLPGLSASGLAQTFGEILFWKGTNRLEMDVPPRYTYT